ncbi:hypothetical protein SNE35_25710 [Paucibacter sp. R3-3]|uniref:DNA-binding protein n=1 Tax=Roseateles agri TaxID=3098619 RepID=A0ABU5DPA0_9BURK|nr:hypothetical protein [Paucibacter sp. R3-3]MDY0747924.1 hypothetical protein [Paucibacter sp. R3-3]
MANKKSEAAPLATLAMPANSIAQELGIRTGELLLTPAQVAEMLQTNTDQLSTMREVGDGPPFTKLGDGKKAPVRYHLGKLRDWIEGHTFQNTSMLNVSRFHSLADFLGKGTIMDSYAAAIDADGDAFEFWESVDSQRDIVEVRWMRMHDMLEAFRMQANRRFAEAEAKEIGEKGPRGYTETI